MTTAAVVLAAGGGKRFAGASHKLLSEFRGRPLVQWSVEAALLAGLDETIVVSGAVDLAEVVPEAATLLVNHHWAHGQAGSLRTAVDWARRQGHRALVVGLGDQPLVRAEDWAAVAAARDTPIAVATFGGRRRPPTRLASSVWDLLPVGGDEGARVVMAARPDLVTEVACSGEPADVDTVEDLSRWS